jgi:hypothetical protein
MRCVQGMGNRRGCDAVAWMRYEKISKISVSKRGVPLFKVVLGV